jgi:hypothetical protein
MVRALRDCPTLTGTSAVKIGLLSEDEAAALRRLITEMYGE